MRPVHLHLHQQFVLWVWCGLLILMFEIIDLMMLSSRGSAATVYLFD